MKRYCGLLILLALLLTACGTTGDTAVQAVQPAGGSGTATATGSTVQVDVVYLGHPPVRRVLEQVDQVLATYGSRVSISRYDFGTPEGAQFAQSKDLKQHTPLAIFINGSMQFTVQDRQISFYSFPSGQGTLLMSGGNWTLDDLKQVLDLATGSRP